ncbi:RDD family protein [Hamadaea tsunoensis]|uniref:RDD family protein n=1 Tax=Hamadaea tsunoensis TaxID=53368 RepID=UPI000414964B|nr:RDD family protein [Hamadaea tsunoensis]
MKASAPRRLAAWLVDWLLISVYAAALIPVGVLFGRSLDLSGLAWNAVSFAILVAPVTLWLAAWEARGASPGKRVLRLRVSGVDGDGAPGFGRALVRNLLKVALPWELAHTGVFLFLKSGEKSGDDTLGTVFIVAAWLVALAYAACLLPGRMPYDAVTGLAVGRAQ